MTRRRLGMVALVLLLALAAVTVITGITRYNDDFTARQQKITNCEVVYHYSQKRCEHLYP